MRKILWIVALLPVLACADPSVPTRDIQGASDLPYLKRYEGSFIVEQVQKSFDEFDLPLGKLEKTGKLDGVSSDIYAPSQKKTVEGKVTRSAYFAPADRSPLEVIRNYQEELTNNELEVLFECRGKECGGRDEDGANTLSDLGPNNVLDSIFPFSLAVQEKGSVGYCTLADDHTDQRYVAMKMTTPDNTEVHLALLAYTLKGTEVFAAAQYGECKPLAGRTALVVVAVEGKAREQRMVTVMPADDMSKGIGTDGHVALYGIHFDYDKADLKPDSKPQLEEIAKMLKADTALNVLVVGHTDNQGELAYNAGLSERRAAAVVQALGKDYGIDTTRLSAYGDGMTAPVASNDTEEGRAKNRRVEIVKR